MSRLFYRAILRTMPEDALIQASHWNTSDGEPMNMEAEELTHRWGAMSASQEGA
ncbi:hypothetical protein [Cupriavidus sp. TMH.W2]|uniref:hypothetical protein n=1 Tax=Cupriavidus sp. TMH.W2 TaxID=3434465 RepID=UPI003D7723B7